jgi:hypothetical protein
MSTSAQPPDSLHPFRELARALRDAALDRDYPALGQLLAEHLQPELVDVLVYIRPAIGHITLVGRFIHLWSPPDPNVIGREPTLEEMAVVLRAAARRP